MLNLFECNYFQSPGYLIAVYEGCLGMCWHTCKQINYVIAYIYKLHGPLERTHSVEFPVSVCKDHTVKQRSYKHLCKQSLEIQSPVGWDIENWLEIQCSWMNPLNTALFKHPLQLSYCSELENAVVRLSSWVLSTCEALPWDFLRYTLF